MESKETKVKQPVKPITGQLAEQVMNSKKRSILRTCSKDKLMNGKVACTGQRNKNCKLPRVVRVQSKSNVITGRLGVKLDESGDNGPGPSKVPGIPTKKNFTQKLKPSHIPRRKTTFKETSNKEHSSKKDYQFVGDGRSARNVQRVQLLINQDFRTEDHIPASIAATRPIPTLGQIYTRNNVIDHDILDDWFVELDAPANSVASNFISSRNVQAENEIPTTKYNASAVTNMEFDTINFKPSAHRTADENVSDWLSTDMEYPTRDNESGYRSQSPPTHIQMDVKSKNSQCSILLGQDEKERNTHHLSASRSKNIIKNQTINASEITAATLKEQPTVVLTQPTLASIKRENDHTTEENETNPKPDQSKNSQYPSRLNCAPLTRPSQTQVTVPSYVECPSEILQKTTNFEGDDMTPVPCDLPNVISSSICGVTELDFHDDLSSQYTLEQGESCLYDHSTIEWCHHCRSCERDEKSNISEDTSVADSLICQYNDSLINSLDDQYVHHCCWKSHYQSVKHCKKCQRYRRFPSTRYKLPKTLSMLRRRMSLRICRRRLSRVWKKTTERWAMWSAKSPHKFRKLRVMHYLQRSILWEDADVQTNMFVCRETGTEATLKELRSAGVSAIAKNGNNLTCMQNAPEKNLRAQENLQEKQNSIGKVNGVDNLESSDEAVSHEPEKNIYHVITQTTSRFYSKDKNAPRNKYDVVRIPEYKSDNFVEICEVSMDDKDTGTGDMLSPMQDNETCTDFYFDTIQPNIIWEAQNAYTQMQFVCNNAGTDVKFPSLKENHPENALTSMSDYGIFSPCGTNTDLKSLRSVNIMTSRESLKCSPTFSHIETQITPVQSMTKISTCIWTSKSYCEKKSAKIDTSTEMTDDIKNSTRDFSNQVMPYRPSFQCTVNKSTTTSISMVAVNEAYSETSKKELKSTEVLTCETQVKSGVCLTTPSLQQCRCPVVEFSSRGTGVNDSFMSTSPNKLKTYFNTGMLVNTLVEGALMQTDAKPSCKNRYPKRLSLETNSNLKHLSRSRMSGTSRKSSNLSQKRTDHSTQYSCAIEKDSALPCCSTRTNHSRLLSIRNLSHSSEESAAQTDPVRINDDHTKILSSSPLTSPRNFNFNKNSSLRLDTSAVLSRNMNADTWIKSCIEKGYQGQIEMGHSLERDSNSYGYKSSIDKKSDSKSVGSETQPENQPIPNNVTTVASAVTDTALEKYKENPTKDTNAKQIVQMVDDVTSADEVLRKQVKEMTLQSSPESCDAATECPQAKEKKSVYVLTSRCALPKPSQCNNQIQNSQSFNGGTGTSLLSVMNTCSASMLTSPALRSTAVVTSHCKCPNGPNRFVPQSDQSTQQDSIFSSKPNMFSVLHVNREERGLKANCVNPHARLLEVPTHDNDPECLEECVRSQLVAGCRYYSILLTKQLERVRENLTRHLPPCKNTKCHATYHIPSINTEACTMKPSACEEFGCQTLKYRPYYQGSKYATALSPVISLIDIRQNDKEHLKSVYYMLTAIEGRLRRLKS